jgi:predicted dehydrogenase/nucleoside-diphosphate-sugar epimerase
MSNQKNPRIGVVGCGAIAELYHLPALAANPCTRQGIALAEPNQTRLKAMKEQFQAVVTCTDYRELVGKVDGVIIATPPHLHYEMTKFFLEQKIPVVCEKPLSESSAEVADLIEISKRTGTPLGVNQTRRFFPTYQKIRELIATGGLGKLQSITYHDGFDFNWPAASPHHFQPNAKGTWSDTGVHLLDSVCYWLGATPTLIRSQNDSHGGPEAMATVNLEHEGCQIEIKVSRYDRLMNGFRIVGTLGSIEAEAEDWDEFTVQFRDGRSKRYKCASNRLKYNDFAKPMLDNFVEVISKRVPPRVSGESVLGTIQLLEQAYAEAVNYPTPWNEELKEWKDAKSASGSGEQLPRVLVTGVSGFLGGRVAEAMVLSELFEPVAAIRNWSRAARVATYAMRTVICDILHPQHVDAAVKNVDAIVHCAYTDDRTAIVDGTRNLLEAAAKHGVSNFVYLSSAEVYGSHRAGQVDENVELAATGRAYGDAKLEAENLCRSYADHGVWATILRPSLIYGPDGQSWSVGIADKLQSGHWGLFEGMGEGFANLIYVDDLIQAIFLSLQSVENRHRTYNVNGPETPTWNEYFKRFNAALGLPPLKSISPSRSKLKTRAMDMVRNTTSAIKARFEDRLMEIYLRGGWAGQMMKRLKGRLDTTPSGGELHDLYSRKAVYVDERIQEELGYRPTYDLDRGMQSTIQWMLLHEYLKQPELVMVDPKIATKHREAERILS